jgi:Tfp pilus assembly protein PilO
MALNLNPGQMNRLLNWRDPRVLMRVVLFTLLLANLVAFYFVMVPLGGSPEELDARVAALQQQLTVKRNSLQRVKGMSGKMTSARREAEQFEARSFTDRRVAYSTLVGELAKAAQETGIRVKEHALANEEVEGSDSLGMITVNANYEGTYGDLLQFVNRMDRSPRFIIMESLSATPQQGSNLLNVAMKMNIFVRQIGPGTAPAAAPVKEVGP